MKMYIQYSKARILLIPCTEHCPPRICIVINLVSVIRPVNYDEAHKNNIEITTLESYKLASYKLQQVISS